MPAFVSGDAGNSHLRRPIPGGYFLLALFTLCNTLDSADRTVLGGSFDEVTKFLRTDLHTDAVDAAFGSLTSVFIVGFSISAVTVGQLSKRFPKHSMTIVAALAALWCISVLICSTAGSYAVLLAGRALSGLGEAAWLTVVPPILLDLCEREHSASIGVLPWLALLPLCLSCSCRNSTPAIQGPMACGILFVDSGRCCARVRSGWVRYP
jgi:MFS family permease